ncbi:muscle-specific protein [Anaeramoeba ignava]|uniref:Muscle-specific protein n=1 Tax=Anaeramoeba ignava TaxID=1746090 RepID=A0A9Q0RCL5_ANAIG|nr:muscle-specific protein [Anaeramoeba ignava]
MDLKEEIINWMSHVIQEEISKNIIQFSIQLCSLINSIQPNTIKTISNSSSENLTQFINACQNLGIKNNQLITSQEIINQDEKFFQFISLLKNYSNQKIKKQEKKIKEEKTITKTIIWSICPIKDTEIKGFVFIIYQHKTRNIFVYSSPQYASISKSKEIETSLHKIIEEKDHFDSKPNHISFDSSIDAFVLIRFESSYFIESTISFQNLIDSNSSFLSQIQTLFNPNPQSKPNIFLSLKKLLEQNYQNTNALKELLLSFEKKNFSLIIPVKFEKLTSSSLNPKIIQVLLIFNSKKFQLQKESKDSLVFEASISQIQNISFDQEKTFLQIEVMDSHQKIVQCKIFTGITLFGMIYQTFNSLLEKSNSEKKEKKDSFPLIFSKKQDLFIHKSNLLKGRWSNLLSKIDMNQNQNQNQNQEDFPNSLSLENFIDSTSSEIKSNKWKDIVIKQFGQSQITDCRLHLENENTHKKTQLPVLLQFFPTSLHIIIFDSTKIVVPFSKQLEILFNKSKYEIEFKTPSKNIVLTTSSLLNLYCFGKTYQLIQRYKGSSAENYVIDGEIMGTEEEIKAITLRCFNKEHANFQIKFKTLSAEEYDLGIISLAKSHFTIFSQSHQYQMNWNEFVFKSSVDDKDCFVIQMEFKLGQKTKILQMQSTSQNNTKILYQCFELFQHESTGQNLVFSVPKIETSVLIRNLDLNIPKKYRIPLSSDRLSLNKEKTKLKINEDLSDLKMLPYLQIQQNFLNYLPTEFKKSLYYYNENDFDSDDSVKKDTFRAIALNQYGYSSEFLTIEFLPTFFKIATPTHLIERKYSLYSQVIICSESINDCYFFIDEIHFLVLRFPQHEKLWEFFEKFQGYSKSVGKIHEYQCKIKTAFSLIDVEFELRQNSFRIIADSVYVVRYSPDNSIKIDNQKKIANIFISRTNWISLHFPELDQLIEFTSDFKKLRDNFIGHFSTDSHMKITKIYNQFSNQKCKIFQTSYSLTYLEKHHQFISDQITNITLKKTKSGNLLAILFTGTSDLFVVRFLNQVEKTNFENDFESAKQKELKRLASEKEAVQELKLEKEIEQLSQPGIYSNFQTDSINDHDIFSAYLVDKNMEIRSLIRFQFHEEHLLILTPNAKFNIDYSSQNLSTQFEPQLQNACEISFANFSPMKLLFENNKIMTNFVSLLKSKISSSQKNKFDSTNSANVTIIDSSEEKPIHGKIEIYKENQSFILKNSFYKREFSFENSIIQVESQDSNIWNIHTLNQEQISVVFQEENAKNILFRKLQHFFVENPNSQDGNDFLNSSVDLEFTVEILTKEFQQIEEAKLKFSKESKLEILFFGKQLKFDKKNLIVKKYAKSKFITFIEVFDFGIILFQFHKKEEFERFLLLFSKKKEEKKEIK